MKLKRKQINCLRLDAENVVHKEKIDILNFIKIKTFCYLKESLKREKKTSYKMRGNPFKLHIGQRISIWNM